MEETIIEAKFKKIKLATVLYAIGIVSLVVGLCMAISKYNSNVGSDYFLTMMLFERREWYIPVTIYTAVLLFIIASILDGIMNKCALKVTDKRVTGKASFGKQVDLPLNQISAISLGSSNSIGVATSSGKITFWSIENRNEVYSALSNLVNDLQSKQVYATSPAAPAGTADELQKYKNLLDNGVITQEEFDAKKKQLLGL